MALLIKFLFLPFQESWTALTQTPGGWIRNWMSFLLLPSFTFPLPDPAWSNAASTKSFWVLRQDGVSCWRHPLTPCFSDHLVPDRLHQCALGHGWLQTSEHNRIFSLLDSCQSIFLPQQHLKILILKSTLWGWPVKAEQFTPHSQAQFPLTWAACKCRHSLYGALDSTSSVPHVPHRAFHKPAHKGTSLPTKCTVKMNIPAALKCLYCQWQLSSQQSLDTHLENETSAQKDHAGS